MVAKVDTSGDLNCQSCSVLRIQDAPINAGYPDPVSLTVCPYSSIDLLTSPTLPGCAVRLRRRSKLYRRHLWPYFADEA